MRVIDVRAEHHRGRPLGVGQARPRLSWITDTDAPGWWQAAYEIEIDGNSAGRVESDRSVFAPWPGTPLASRGRVVVRVRTWVTDGSESDWSEPLEIEAGLLEAGEWVAEWISPVTRDPLDVSSPAPFLRRSFQLACAVVVRARLYVTSAGIHHVHLNGVVIGDHLLAPGWSSYTHRLRYDTHDVTDLVRAGENVLGAIVADGWWRGHLGWDMLRNRYGDRLGLLAQLEVDLADGTRVVVVSDDDWSTRTGPILSSDLYNGETYDARADLDAWDQAGYDDSGWCPVERFAPAARRSSLRSAPAPLAAEEPRTASR